VVAALPIATLKRLKAHAIDSRVNIFVPPRAKRDKTRNPGFYEGVSRYLTDLGVTPV